MRKWSFTLAIILTLLLVSQSTSQSGFKTEISNPIIDDFPIVSFDLKVFDQSGNFIHDLSSSNFNLLENEVQIQDISLAELQAGTHFVIAGISGNSLTVRDEEGLSRFDYIRDDLINDLEGLSQELGGSYSLVFSGIPNIAHSDDPQELISALNSLDTEILELDSELNTIFQAIDFASDPTSRTGMGRSILLITPLLEGDLDSYFEDIKSRAVDSNIRINVWLISPPDTESIPAGQRLQNLANETGGDFFAFRRDQAIPDILEYIEPLAYYYRLEYTSQIRESSQVSVSVSLEIDAKEIEFPIKSYQITITPPNPILLNPRIEITRSLPKGAEFEDTSLFQPDELEFEFVLDFPDGTPRELRRSYLLVNGLLVSENIAPPFNKFNWDISGVNQTGDFTINIQVEDILGAVGISSDHILTIKVKKPAFSYFEIIKENQLVFAIAIVGALVILLVLLFILRGRIKPISLWALSRKRSKRSETKLDPSSSLQKLQEKVIVEPIPTKDKRKVLAIFEYLTGEGVEQKDPIPIYETDLIIGSDPERVDLILIDRSVTSIHAHLRYSPSGKYILQDLGSIAGTWVNHSMVMKEGVEIVNGDIIHIGSIGFTFISKTKPD